MSLYDQHRKLYLPTDPLTKAEISLFTLPLARRIKNDFPGVRDLVFLRTIREIVKHDGDRNITYNELPGVFVDEGMVAASGFSTQDGLAAIVPATVKGLVGLVDTALHEAGHIANGNDPNCEKPNEIAGQLTQSYLTRLLT